MNERRRAGYPGTDAHITVSVMVQLLTRDALAQAAKTMLPGEREAYARRRPASLAQSRAAGPGFHDGVPLHWMRDWPTPFPMVVASAEGALLADLDGNRVVDLCLGDTGAMFGHAPAPIARVLAGQAGRAWTAMLPTRDAVAVGRLLAERFGLPCWQVATTASDANRFAIRAARAVTGRRRILVFDGCYHGAVDDTLVDLVGGRTVARKSLLGQAADPGATTVAVPFNDVAALERALAGGDIAVVLAEPVMTNCGMIQPRPGFHDALRRLTRAHGTLLLIDETHTLSTGLGGYTAVHGLEPDLLVAGKAVAGGLPAAVWGFTRAVGERLDAASRSRPPGHSGIGTTLSGSALQLACLRACLEEVMTAQAYAAMEAQARLIAENLAAVIAQEGLPWHVSRVGARLEVVLRPEPLVDAADARAASCPAIESALHLGLLNRGFLLTPFHNMVLVSPALARADAAAFVQAFARTATELAATARS